MMNYKINIVHQHVKCMTDFFYWVTNTQIILINLTNALV
jgi:hypothetical protein